MAGIEELQPPMSSDPNFRMWSQIRSLQARVAALEARRNLDYRLSATNYVAVGTDSMRFVSAGRPLLVVFGPNRLLIPTYTGGAPRRGNADATFNFPTPENFQTFAVSFDTNPNGAFHGTNVNAGVVEGVPAGEWTVTFSQTGASELRYSILVLELPA